MTSSPQLRHPLTPLLLAAACLLMACGGGAEEGGTGGPAPQEPPGLQPIPARGSPTTLDVGEWNLEWFGDRANGPASESAQQDNVRAVLAGVDLDVWGVAEVADSVQLQRTVNAVPGFTALVANDPSVTGGSAFYGAAEQKVGLVYRTTEVQVLSARVILTERDSDFAGRPPLEARLRVSPGGAPAQELVLIVLHMKAFADASSYQRRVAAGAALKAYLDATYPTQAVAVVGDFNDDVDTSITAGQPSPYKAFVDDAARYTFPTLALSQAGLSSTASYPDVIDHHLVTNELAARLVPNSVEALRLEASIANYADSTSDHYPVLSSYFPE